MKRLLTYIFSLMVAWILCPGLIHAQLDGQDRLQHQDSVKTMTGPDTLDRQSTKPDSLDQVSGSDTISYPFFNRLEFKIDYLKLVSFALDTENKAEAGLGLILGRGFGINTEMGYGEKTPENHFENADYKVSGYYGRVGFSYHLEYNPGTNFFIGAKFGLSHYQDEATYTIESPLWDNFTGTIERSGLQGKWVEIAGGSESRYKGNFFLGFTFRFRALIDHDNFSPLEVFAIPGYGRTMDKTLPALNLHIKYILDFTSRRNK